MSNIQLLFEVPSHIEIGLKLGTYERVGGVVRDGQTKQVIMWLQEGGHLSNELANPVNEAVVSLLRSSGLSSRTASAVLGGSIAALNVGLTAYNLYRMSEKINQLEQEINDIHSQVSEEFARDRRVEFEAALANAHDVVDAESDLYKQQAANLAIDKLFKAEKQRLEDFNRRINENNDLRNVLSSQKFLQQAMMATTMRIKCILETNQHDMAMSRLRQSIGQYAPYIETLVKKLLGENPEMYFHEDIDDEDFERYLRIQSWLRDEVDVLPQLVREYRSSFWNEKSVKLLNTSGSRIQSFFTRTTDEDDRGAADHLRALTLAEIAIEDYNRLIGFELEVASIRLTTEQIQTIESHDNYVFLVDSNLLSATSRISQ